MTFKVEKIKENQFRLYREGTATMSGLYFTEEEWKELVVVVDFATLPEDK